MDYTILINKNNKLDKDFVPNNLIECSVEDAPRLDGVNRPFLEEKAMLAFLEMKAAAKLEDIDIVVESGYRSYQYQDLVLKEYIEKMGNDAHNYAALPGCSEHQSGLAVDIAIIRDGEYIGEEDINDNLSEVVWLHNNCHRYGFILRYPKGKEDITGYNYEWWHFRYVGKELANFMYCEGIETLEEYYDLKNKM